MRVNKILIFLVVLATSLFFATSTKAATLNGRILLQVEEHGEAWYVNPLNSTRYFLGRPDDAFKIMRQFGLGATTSDINKFLFSSAPQRLSGRILLQVEDNGQAYYVNPVNLKLYYLGRPADAFSVMRNLGLGITNTDLNKIAISFDSNTATKVIETPEVSDPSPYNNSETRAYSFKYENKSQNLILDLSPSLYQEYTLLPKTYTYPASSPPDNIQESFYKMFLQLKEGDDSIYRIISALKVIAQNNNWSGDKVAELALAFVQYIPYADEKLEASKIIPYYPYETLYLKRGVCSDTSYIAYLLLKELGYGVAIMDFPDVNHSALGVQCETKYSLNNSGYCYVETTNYFPFGVIPQNINNGVVVDNGSNYDTLFNSATLGRIEIYNKTSANAYYGMTNVVAQAEELKSLYNYITYNRPEANASYDEVVSYNEKVDAFNKLQSDFYQK